MGLINHRNIIKYINSFKDIENPYIVMWYIEGQNLEQLLKSGPVDEQVVVRIIYQLLLALKGIHGKKIVHKDIKPDNNLLAQREREIKLADFGIGKILEFEGNTDAMIQHS